MIDFLVIVSSITDTFIDGTSPVRPLLFLLFALSVVVASLLPSAKRDREVSRVAAGVVTLLFASTFLLQLYVFFHAGIPQHALAIAITEGEITNTRLTHTHVGKVGLAGIVPGSMAQQFDTGAAMLLLVPSSIAIGIAVLLITATALVVYTLSRRMKDVRSRRLIYVLLASLVGCTALAKSIDGGILSDGAVIAYAALMGLLLAPSRLFTTYLSFGAIAFACAIAVAHLTGFYWGEGYAVTAVLKGGTLLLVVLALHQLLNHGMSKKSVLLALGAAVLVASVSIQAASERLSYLNHPIEEGKTMVRHNDGSVTSGDAYVGKTTRTAIEQEKLTYWYQPVMHTVNSCSDQTASYVGSFFLTPGFVPETQTVSTKYGTLQLTQLGDRYRAEITMHACLPERIKEIQALLREAGLSEAVIYGLEGGERSVRDGDNNR